MKRKVNLHQQAAEKTRTKILEAARQLFIEKGFSGTSIGAIASQADINQSLVYHYFESKEDLWRQVKSAIITALEATAHLAHAPQIKTLNELLQHLVINRFQLHAQNFDLVRLLMWQALENDVTTLSGTSEAWTTSWLEQIASLQKRGIITKALKPQEIMLLLNGIVWAPFVTLPKQVIAVQGKAFCRKMANELKKQLKV